LALRGADIGIAMGRRGTDVAKESAEVVLADDNYITITRGIFEGRKFYDNLKKGIKYYLSVKTALILIFLLPVLIGLPLPFAPIQIIVLELFMDLAASAGFVTEPEEKTIYHRLPRPRQTAFLDSPAIVDILTKGLMLFVAVTSVYLVSRLADWPLQESQTLAFSTWILGHIALAYVSRSDDETLAALGAFKNIIINIWAIGAIIFLLIGIYWTTLSHQLGLAPIKPLDIIVALAAALILPALLELRKGLASSS